MNEIQKAFETIKQAMIDDSPEVQGSYAHAWHCNIAMAVYDECTTALPARFITSEDAMRIGNASATRFMKTCFDVTTKR